MIKLDNFEVLGWEHVVRGMRNPMNSWAKSDSYFLDDDGDMYTIYGNHAPFHGDDNRNGPISLGKNDHELMMKLAKGGSVHAKYRRMITVYVDITAPLYWWKEFDTYKVGTVANSCSTMHKIHEKEFTLEDFSHEKLNMLSRTQLKHTVQYLERYRKLFVNWDDIDDNSKNALLVYDKKDAWEQMIQLLPSSYNQKRTVMLNYEVLTNIYRSRKGHKLDEWNDFCTWIENLPYSEIITGERVIDESSGVGEEKCIEQA